MVAAGGWFAPAVNKHEPRRGALSYRILALAATIFAGCLLAPAATAATPQSAQRLSRRPIAERPGWRRYDEAPGVPVVRPARVLEVTGNVSDPQALTNPGAGQTTTLTDTPGGTAPSLILDYGQNVGGFPEFDVASGAGQVQTSYSETLRNVGNDGATSVTLFQSGNGARSDSFNVLGAGTVKAPMVSGGERYEKVTLSTPGTVTLRSAGIDFSPLRETPSLMAGHFLSSDGLLNRIWYAGAYTLNLNQLMPGTYVADGGVNRLHLLLDGAKRDRAVWSGDQAISDLTDYYVSDPVYARDSLSLFLTHPATTANFLQLAEGVMSQPGPLPGACTPNPSIQNDGCVTWSASYSVVVIPALYNYYLYAGDLGFVRDHWQAVLRQMQWDAQQVDSNGLFSVNSNNADDWNLESPTGEITYVNAVYVEALQSAAKLASALGDTADAKRWAAAAVAVKDAVNRRLWDQKTGVYDASNSIRGAVVQDANVIAILSGIASPRRARGIVNVLRRALATPYGPIVATANASGYIRDISPYMGSFNVLADFAAGSERGALALMRQEWGFMISHDPGGVDWERIQPDGVPAGTSGSLMLADSSAHAWSTGPTAALSEFVLGVAPAAPGYGRWTIAPHPGGLRWAQGTVPTPHGSISVRWRRPERRRFVLTIAAPRGTSGTVAVPLLDRRGTIARSGRVLWTRGHALRGVRARRAGSAVVFAQAAGATTYASAP
jgi:alpha-L-rhamnosidase